MRSPFRVKPSQRQGSIMCRSSLPPYADFSVLRKERGGWAHWLGPDSSKEPTRGSALEESWPWASRSDCTLLIL